MEHVTWSCRNQGRVCANYCHNINQKSSFFCVSVYLFFYQHYQIIYTHLDMVLFNKWFDVDNWYSNQNVFLFDFYMYLGREIGHTVPLTFGVSQWHDTSWNQQFDTRTHIDTTIHNTPSPRLPPISLFASQISNPILLFQFLWQKIPCQILKTIYGQRLNFCFSL